MTSTQFGDSVGKTLWGPYRYSSPTPTSVPISATSSAPLPAPHSPPPLAPVRRPRPDAPRHAPRPALAAHQRVGAQLQQPHRCVCVGLERGAPRVGGTKGWGYGVERGGREGECMVWHGMTLMRCSDTTGQALAGPVVPVHCTGRDGPRSAVRHAARPRPRPSCSRTRQGPAPRTLSGHNLWPTAPSPHVFGPNTPQPPPSCRIPPCGKSAPLPLPLRIHPLTLLPPTQLLPPVLSALSYRGMAHALPKIRPVPTSTWPPVITRYRSSAPVLTLSLCGTPPPQAWPPASTRTLRRWRGSWGWASGSWKWVSGAGAGGLCAGGASCPAYGVLEVRACGLADLAGILYGLALC